MSVFANRNTELEGHIMEFLCGIDHNYFVLMDVNEILKKIISVYGHVFDAQKNNNTIRNDFEAYFGKTLEQVISHMEKNKKIRLYKSSDSFLEEVYGFYDMASIREKERLRKEKQSAVMDRILVHGYVREAEREYHFFCLVGADVINLLILFTLKLYTAFAKGKQTVGELGLGNNYELNKWNQLESFSEYISGTDLEHIYMGKQRFSLLDVQNNIFSVGSNMNGDCGVSSTNYGIFEWKQITEYAVSESKKGNVVKVNHVKELELEIRTLSNGMSAYHTFICTKDNRLFVYGNLKTKQAGSELNDICSNSKYSIYPVEITFKFENILMNVSEKIVQIECGRFHSLFLTDKGNVYSLGRTFKPTDNRTWYINSNSFVCHNDPTLVEFKSNNSKEIIKQICCGFQHSLALTTKHKVYAWGFDVTKGQLGIKPIKTMKTRDNKYYISLPTLNKKLASSDIIFISCGYDDSLCIDSNLICYVFGTTAFATFKGHNPYNTGYWSGGRISNNYFDPYKLDSEFIKDGCCGFNHTALLTVNNELVIINPSSGVKKFTNKQIGLLDGETIEKVVAGYENTIVIAS